MNLLAFLEINRVPRAVASSTPCWFARHKLAITKVDTLFQAIVCGDMVAAGKPAPDLFLEAARQIAIAPERCVVLEDSEAGIMAAHAAGMVPLMIPDLKKPTPEILGLVYRVLPSLNEVIPLMAEFLEKGLPDR
jgi:beta-phosphoglucomutase-like phosphatase (HAD superfamily)